jgi:hypothetical protein
MMKLTVVEIVIQQSPGHGFSQPVDVVLALHVQLEGCGRKKTDDVAVHIESGQGHASCT